MAGAQEGVCHHRAFCRARIGSPCSCTCCHMLFFSGLFLALANVVLTPSHQQLDNTYLLTHARAALPLLTQIFCR